MSKFEIYEKIKLLAEGGFADVHLVKNQKDNNLYVMKQSYKYSCDEEELNTRVFTNEVKSLQSLDRKQIIGYIDSFVDKDYYYLIMPYIDSDIITVELFKLSLQYAEERLCEIIRDQIVELYHTLLYLKTKNIVHNDIKPDNILLDRTEGSFHPVLVDFGLVGEKEYGTDTYADPYIDDQNYSSHASDLYALGKSFQTILEQLKTKGTQLQEFIQSLMFYDPKYNAAEGRLMREKLAQQTCLKIEFKI